MQYAGVGNVAGQGVAQERSEVPTCAPMCSASELLSSDSKLDEVCVDEVTKGGSLASSGDFGGLTKRSEGLQYCGRRCLVGRRSMNLMPPALHRGLDVAGCAPRLGQSSHPYLANAHKTRPHEAMFDSAPAAGAG